MTDALLGEFTEIKARSSKQIGKTSRPASRSPSAARRLRDGDGKGGKYGDKAVVKLAKPAGLGQVQRLRLCQRGQDVAREEAAGGTPG